MAAKPKDQIAWTATAKTSPAGMKTLYSISQASKKPNAALKNLMAGKIVRRGK